MLVAWPYRRGWRGHDTTKKSLLKLMGLALLARCALAHCWWQCVVTSNTKTRRNQSNTGCCWNKFTEFEITGILRFCATKRRGAGEPGNSRRKSVASTVAHQPDLSDVHLSWVGIGDTNFPIPSWSRLGCAQSYLLLRGILSPCSFLSVVLDHHSIMMFWIISFLEHLLVPATLRHAGCGVQSCCCFQNCFIFDFWSFLWLCVMWCWPLHHHQSHSVDVPSALKYYQL